MVIAVAALALSGLSASTAAAAEFTYAFAYRYPHVWRGITLREFPVFNVSATMDHPSGFGLSFWAGLDLSNERHQAGEVQEIDLDFYYRWDLGQISFKAGYVELIFPGGIDSTGEAYLHLRSKTLLSPSLEINYNVDLLRDYFVLLHLQDSRQLNRKISASLKTTIAYAGEQFARFFDATDPGWHHWGATGDLDFALAKGALKLRMAYSDSLDQQVLREQPVKLWGGIYFSITP